MIDYECKYKAMLGIYADRGFRIKETPDLIDEDDALLELYFKDKKIATAYKSKLMLKGGGVQVLQQWCENYWNSMMQNFTGWAEGQGY